MRARGLPSGEIVAKVIALGSNLPEDTARSSHCLNTMKGSADVSDSSNSSRL